jgi:hypothetical protein
MTTLTLEKPELIDRLERIALDHHTTPTALLDTAVEEFLDRVDRAPGAPRHAQPIAPPEFLREIAAFEQLKPELLKQYQGRVVAIYQGQVVAVGDSVLGVHDAVTAKFGPVPCYVEWVEEQTPRRVRMVSAWRAR